MRSWTSYFFMSLLFSTINFGIAYFRDDYWDITGSLVAGMLFLVLLLILDLMALRMRKNKDNK